MLSRINIFKIVKDHLSTLKRLDGHNRLGISTGDLVLFFIFPSVISFVLVFKGYTFSRSLGNLIAAISILGGFLFNLLAIIYSQIDKIKTDIEGNIDENLRVLKQRFVKEIHSNISFCIILSVFLILTLFLIEVDLPEFMNIVFIHKFLLWLNYSLMILFVLTLLMVINRVYILLKKDAE